MFVEIEEDKWRLMMVSFLKNLMSFRARESYLELKQDNFHALSKIVLYLKIVAIVSSLRATL